ncbi:uncharacterized protein LOC112494484 [Cephus cinctus]|uniref:Uncharacterized protein LOC112494484 n=1 Tax=Cephus cinctus TaxID=211228 RepID=A0AAJ7W1Z5_CEPCN|nr:uncharacterized protein LOC112494484 [Cephus cinctus]
MNQTIFQFHHFILTYIKRIVDIQSILLHCHAKIPVLHHLTIQETKVMEMEQKKCVSSITNRNYYLHSLYIQYNLNLRRKQTQGLRLTKWWGVNHPMRNSEQQSRQDVLFINQSIKTTIEKRSELAANYYLETIRVPSDPVATVHPNNSPMGHHRNKTERHYV